MTRVVRFNKPFRVLTQFRRDGDRKTLADFFDDPDLRAGRTTEADQLQGAILELAVRHGCATPVTAAIHRAIKAAEGHAPRAHSPDEIRAA